MCYECRMWGAGPFLCIKDRKVWKGGHECPVCGIDGIKMGYKWRAPKLSNERAWKRVESGDFLWEHPAAHFPRDRARVVRTKEKPRSPLPQWWPGKLKPRKSWEEEVRDEIIRRMNDSN